MAYINLKPTATKGRIGGENEINSGEQRAKKGKAKGVGGKAKVYSFRRGGSKGGIVWISQRKFKAYWGETPGRTTKQSDFLKRKEWKR